MPSNVKLATHSGTAVANNSNAQAFVEFGGELFQLPLLMAENTNDTRVPTLLGHSRLAKIRLNWHESIVDVGAIHFNGVHSTRTE